MPDLPTAPFRLENVRAAIAAELWAILPDKLDAILEVVEFHAAGGAYSEDEIAARIGAGRRGAAPTVAGKVAVLPIMGTIAQRVGTMERASGGTSTEALAEAFDALMRDPSVGAVVLNVDSPGGTVSGVPELAAKIRAARGTKPIVAVANSLMASAAYWIASAADSIVASPSAMLGSIGVFRVHADVSGAAERAGVRHTIIRAGRYKAEGLPYEALSDDARAAMQAQVDELYQQFVRDVAAARGTTPAAVRAGYGEGRMLLAQAAVAAGLADRVATLDAVVAELAGGRPASARAHASTAAGSDSAAEASLQFPSAADAPDAPGAAVPPTSPAAESSAAAATSPVPAPQARSVPVDEETNTAAAGAVVTPTAGGGTAVAPPAASAHVSVNANAGATDYLALAETYGRSLADVRRWQGARMSESQVRAEIMDRDRAATAPIGASAGNPLDVSRKDRRDYSIARAITASMSGDWTRAGYERELSVALGKRIGRESEGVLVPTGMSFNGPQAAGLDTATDTKGQELKFTEAGSFIDHLRKRAMVLALGATMYPGLQGKVAFPKQIGAGTASWQGENPGADASESNLTLDQVELDLKTLISTTSYSKQLLAQGTIDVDSLVRNDLVKIDALALDLAALHGAGGSAPTGLYGATGVNAVAFGGAPTFAKLVAMETAIAAADADIGTMAYLTTAGVRGTAKTTLKAAGVAGYLWENGEMNGYRAEASNQVKSNLGAGTNEHGMLFGVWAELLFGEWGALELLADPYRLKKQGMVEITSTHFVNLVPRYAESFAKGTGLIP